MFIMGRKALCYHRRAVLALPVHRCTAKDAKRRAGISTCFFSWATWIQTIWKDSPCESFDHPVLCDDTVQFRYEPSTIWGPYVSHEAFQCHKITVFVRFCRALRVTSIKSWRLWGCMYCFLHISWYIVSSPKHSTICCWSGPSVPFKNPLWPPPSKVCPPIV